LRDELKKDMEEICGEAVKGNIVVLERGSEDYREIFR